MATRICKVCGVEYEYCRTNRVAPDAFRWQDVACCQKHGSEYFAEVLRVRAEEEAKLNGVVAADNTVATDNVESIESDDEDEVDFFGEDFGDDDDSDSEDNE